MDIINSIALFQLIFFLSFLIYKGEKTLSVNYLVLFLFVQIIPYINYYYFQKGILLLRPLLPLSLSTPFLWGPVFFLYINSRLYLSGKAGKQKTMLHFIPAIIMLIFASFFVFILAYDKMRMFEIKKISYSIIQLQLLVYHTYTLYRIFYYKLNIKKISSSSQYRKIHWLTFITLGIAIISMIDWISFSLFPDLHASGFGYLVFWIFLNVFFFKAIVLPDQFLSLDEKTITLPADIQENITNSFRLIENTITAKSLYLNPDLTLENIAREVNISERQVSQIIKNSTDKYFSDYINSKRIEHAKSLLRKYNSQEMNISEIYFASGFNSKSVFNNQFKKVTGLSPKEYRNQKMD